LPKLQGDIYLTIQYFATKRCNFTKFKMLFEAVVMDFSYFKVFQILVIRLKSIERFIIIAEKMWTQIDFVKAYFKVRHLVGYLICGLGHLLSQWQIRTVVLKCKKRSIPSGWVSVLCCSWLTLMQNFRKD
jgi:hypothetical protein